MGRRYIYLDRQADRSSEGDFAVRAGLDQYWAEELDGVGEADHAYYSRELSKQSSPPPRYSRAE